MALALEAEYVQACSFKHALQMVTDKRQMNYKPKCYFYTKIPVKSSQVDEFKNDTQMFAFMAAE